MPCTDAALCTAQPHVGESTVICNLAVTFEDQDVPSSSEDDPVAAEVSYGQLNGPFDEFILAALSRFEVFLLREDAIWLCPQNPILEAEADDFSGRYSTEVIVGGGSKARPVQPSSTQPKAEQRYAAEAQHGVGQSSRRSEAHQPPCNSMNPWGTGTFAYCSLCGSL
ncbi:hypothetical protein FOFC_10448, partial [Fusarium oxysporum]